MLHGHVCACCFITRICLFLAQCQRWLTSGWCFGVCDTSHLGGGIYMRLGWWLSLPLSKIWRLSHLRNKHTFEDTYTEHMFVFQQDLCLPTKKFCTIFSKQYQRNRILAKKFDTIFVEKPAEFLEISHLERKCKLKAPLTRLWGAFKFGASDERLLFSFVFTVLSSKTHVRHWILSIHFLIKWSTWTLSEPFIYGSKRKR